ncbi:class I SAM-dependent methyltransferase [Agromyces bracchium]|uniref:Class I SAM-dependent methyltransferase n=1 Tax=Agromyces bracchium TaxID=88376 RepID=A0A6I3M2T6_9MICO|nr:class I SAM-dependent methyltransferase [Agromyces bracchium]MTH68910.1 class I SAM-dependent methyltransferase [Agromyces bracchium]
MTQLRSTSAFEPWRIAEAFWEPQVLVDSAWHRHAPFAFWLVGALRPRRFVELGTHNGFSFFTVCEALQRFEVPDASATAVDTWLGDDQAGYYGPEVHRSVEAIARERYPGIARLERSTFDEAAVGVPAGSIDLLHIDGRHGYDDVAHDFETWSPKLTERAVVVFHDTSERTEGFGVWRFWAEVAERHPSFAFVHGHGLGVLAVGDDVPSEVLEFIDVARAEPDAVEAWFAERGEAVARAHAAAAARAAEDARRAAEIAALTAENATLRARLDAAAEERRHILASTSWRITAPARAAGALARRLRRPGVG